MSKLVVQDLKVQQGTFWVEIKHLEVHAGQVLGIMGSSGSGKTTLLNSIAGFVPLTSGRIYVSDREIQSLNPEKRKVSVVFQQPYLFENRNVLENICFGLRLQKVSQREAEQLARYWLEKMEIPDLADRATWQLSGGQAQRVALARALAVKFPVILLDEPFSSLDAPVKKGLRKLFGELVKELQICAVLVSHDWRDFDGLAERVAILKDGKCVLIDTLENIKKDSREEIRAIFES